jgi:hypothetical protein
MLRFYRTDLERFVWWCTEHRISRDPTTMTLAQIRNFLRYVQTSDTHWGKPDYGMSNRLASDKTVNAYDRCLRSAFDLAGTASWRPWPPGSWEPLPTCRRG